MSSSTQAAAKTAFITGAAQRIGACLAQAFHQAGFNIVIHYRQSAQAAQELAQQLNQQRPESAALVQGELDSKTAIETVAAKALAAFGQIDLLLNNASSFYPTEIGSVSEQDWDDLMGPNLKAPLFLSQALNPSLQQQQGCIINIIDIHAQRPLAKHPVYCSAKAGLAMLTKSLAKDLSPAVRVNGIAPGAIMWPQQAGELTEEQKREILLRIPMQRSGSPEDIVETALFLARQQYITGQIIAVDGGRSLHA